MCLFFKKIWIKPDNVFIIITLLIFKNTRLVDKQRRKKLKKKDQEKKKTEVQKDKEKINQKRMTSDFL